VARQRLGRGQAMWAPRLARPHRRDGLGTLRTRAEPAPARRRAEV